MYEGTFAFQIIKKVFFSSLFLIVRDKGNFKPSLLIDQIMDIALGAVCPKSLLAKKKGEKQWPPKEYGTPPPPYLGNIPKKTIFPKWRNNNFLCYG